VDAFADSTDVVRKLRKSSLIQKKSVISAQLLAFPAR
jgi:hypothetical protein